MQVNDEMLFILGLVVSETRNPGCYYVIPIDVIPFHLISLDFFINEIIIQFNLV